MQNIFTSTDQANAQDNAAASAESIFDAGTNDFESKVLEKSREVPVLVDFWAPWCGPCKTLTPILETEIRQAGGKVLLAKVNIDEHPDLAKALQVQSVPAVFAFFNGQPVTGFTGAKPQSEIKELIGQLAQMAGQSQGGQQGPDIQQALKDAADALSKEDFQQAGGYYQAILQHDPENAEAYSGLIRTALAEGKREMAQNLMDQVPQSIAQEPAFEQVKTAFELSGKGGENDLADLEAKVEKAPQDHALRYDLAMALYAANKTGEAIDQLLEILSKDQDWQEGEARQTLLKIFDALGPQDPETIRGRRRLSSLLFR